jgi:subtilisin
MAEAKRQQFILMPRRGVRDSAMLDPLLQPDRRPKALFAMSVARGAIKARRAPSHDIRVLHSIHEDGLKLAEMSREAVLNLRVTLPGVRVVPLVEYRTAERQKFMVTAAVKTAARASGNLGLNIKAAGKVTPLAGAHVVAFTDFAKGEGLDGTSNASGVALIGRNRASVTIERLFVYPPNGYWGHYAENTRINDGDTIELPMIDLAAPDLVTTLYGDYPRDAGSGVKIGIIDTGVARDHPDIVLAGGKNLVRGENPADFGPAADHGSHVAGIVGARGAAPTGKRGVAPGVTLMSYRVFGQGAEKADNYAIARAIDQAVADKCDLINMSLGGGERDPAVEESVNAAYQAGTLSICATGNDSRQPVSFPALLQQVLAVSAFGQRGTFPAKSIEAADIEKPFAASNRERFIAAFSNIGQEVALTGPGVGVVSTVPAKDYATMSGTSMACPAVTGCVAAILSQQPNLLKMPRDQKRTQAFIKAALVKAVVQGFGPADGGMEGHGLL